MDSYRIAVLVSNGNESIGEYVFHVKNVDSELQAVNKLYRSLRTNLQYKFLGENGFVIPSELKEHEQI